MHESSSKYSGDALEKLSRSFLWLNTTQFLGALNDNLLKLFIVFFLIGLKGAAEAGAISAIAGAIFVLPFLLFSASAGVLADRVGKRGITVSVKLIEVIVTALAAVAFLMKSEYALYAVLFLMATHSALFAPSKYGIVPEIVKQEQLSRANSLLESFTYFAIILGSSLAPLLAQSVSYHYGIAALFCVAIAFGGLISSRNIEATPSACSSKKFSPFFADEIWETLKSVRRDGYLLLAVIGSAYFMFVGAFTQINLIPYGMQVLHLAQEKSGYLFFVGAIAIGLGSLLSGKVSGRNVEFGVVPIGAAGITLSMVSLGLIPPALYFIVSSIFVLGVGAGLFIVPLQSFIQMRSPREKLGEILAASSFLSWTGVLIAAGMTYLFNLSGMSARHGFMVIGIVTLALTVITVLVLPDFLVRFMALIPTRLIYRIKVIGGRNVPMEGPALLVANHVTWADALLLMSTQQRRIRFVMDRGIYNNRVLNPLFRLMGVIPVSSSDSQKEMFTFIRETRKALNDGYMLCIFAEGAVTRNGMMQEFKPGVELIARGGKCPIIPVYIGGAWGSILSYAHGRLLAKLPNKLPYPITVLFGKPMQATSTAAEIRHAVIELSADYFESKKTSCISLGEAYITSARRNWKCHAVSDTSGKKLTYGETLTGSLALSERIKKDTLDQKYVGIMLPASVGGAISNLAVTLLGKVPVNLNYTTSAVSVQSSIEKCGIKYIITSKALKEKLRGLPAFEGEVYLEDLVKEISPISKISAWAKARFMPRRKLIPEQIGADDLATVIFSSGSTGEPKGIMLTHYNIQSNIEGLKMVLGVTPNDNICAALPFFHSLGFTGTLWLPLLSGFSAAYHSNPMDGAKIAEVVRTKRSTLLLATPTFLTLYTRAAKPGDFASLRLVVAGAEKLKEKVARNFHEKFGIRPLEGYGATELSPVVALSLPDTEIDKVFQKGFKEGSVGHPLPGVAVEIIDQETRTPLPIGEHGLVKVKGPNVMKGYLNQPDMTAETINDGWYFTGDIGWLDNDGFLYITDRLSRFSKIGGEMVPHGTVEDELQDGLGQSARLVAVTSVPDDVKGERLVVLYQKGACEPETLRRIMAESLLPNLWKPCRDCYIEVDSIPVLGSGKLDIQTLRRQAIKAVAISSQIL